MMKETRRGLLVGLAVAGLASAACSLVLEWDPEGLLCEPGTGDCSKGYSCLVNKCVSHRSLLEGDTCNKNIQCKKELSCAPTLFTCRKTCSSGSYWATTSNCGGGQFCRPFPVGEPNQLEFTGVCVESDGCRGNADCSGSGEKCVPIGSNVTACILGCDMDWTSGYQDGCNSTVTSKKYCQPVGRSDEERLVCLDTKPGAQSAGDGCTPVSNPCQERLVCHNSKCYKHCNPQADQSTACTPDVGGPAETCCAIEETNSEEDYYGICVPSPGTCEAQ